MFDFFVDLFQERFNTYRYQVDSGKQIAVQGYKTVLKIDENVIILKLANGELEILGSNLRVKELGTNTIIITGEIKTVSTAGGDNGK